MLEGGLTLVDALQQRVRARVLEAMPRGWSIHGSGWNIHEQELEYSRKRTS